MNPDPRLSAFGNQLVDIHQRLREHLTALREDLLRRVGDLVDGLGPDPDPVALGRVRTEVDTLAALVESHFTYEERRLVAVLNTLAGEPVRLS